MRDAHHEHNVDWFRRIALREAGLDTSPLPDWEHEGFTTPGLPDNEVRKSWWRLRKYHMPLTVQLEQPPEWWDDIDQCEAIFNTLLDQAYAEVERSRDQDAR